ncbi:Pycsar system effector family protein [Streptomyces pratens]|uniref:Pycsar system effector family protein n=1 Tax=Streptomyces pratens TaxID=887456 RepID=A0ABW1M8M8_9ACTN
MTVDGDVEEPRRRAPEETDSTSGMLVLRDLIEQNFGEIGRADAKASVLLATAGALFGILLSGHPHRPGWSAVLWWTAVAGAAAALLTLLLAVLPRRSAHPPDGSPSLAYFEDVLHASRQARLAQAVLDDGSAPGARLLRTVEGTSRIASAKNRYIRCAVALITLALAAFLGVLMSQ